MTQPLTLTAIDGSNPLGFLAALGALRLAALYWPNSDVRLAWHKTGHWVPILCGAPVEDAQSLSTALLSAPFWAPVQQFSTLGKNLTVSPDVFRKFADRALSDTSCNDRRLSDFVVAFGCEDCYDEKEKLRYTQLCFITGSGHQDFLGTATALAQQVTASHLQEALFDGWRGEDKGLAFRWDPTDAREYALRWSDPSKEGAWSTWGANRLAFEALPFFPVQPSSATTLATTGFSKTEEKGERRKDELTWPIWVHPLSSDEIKSLIGLSELQEPKPNKVILRCRGVEEVFRSTRVRIGQGANFKVSFRPARSI